jgi:hypothetical protein
MLGINSRVAFADEQVQFSSWEFIVQGLNNARGENRIANKGGLYDEDFAQVG